MGRAPEFCDWRSISRWLRDSMRTPSFLLLLGLAAVYADGLSPMKREAVLPRADAIALVQIIACTETITERDGGGDRTSVHYSYSIEAQALSTVKGEVPTRKLDLIYDAVVVKGVWLSWPGSGLEMHMKPKEKYLFLFTCGTGKLELLRVEEAAALQSVEALLKAQREDTSANLGMQADPHTSGR